MHAEITNDDAGLKAIIWDKIGEHTVWQISNLLGLIIYLVAPAQLKRVFPQVNVPLINPDMLVLTATIVTASAGISYLLLEGTIHNRLRGFFKMVAIILLIVNYSTLAVMWALRQIWVPGGESWDFALLLLVSSWLVATFLWWHEKYLARQKPSIPEQPPSRLVRKGQELAAQSADETVP